MIINDKLGLKEAIINKLEQVFDPEIPVNIYELGLIYELYTDSPGIVKIVMTLTAPNCPAADLILRDVQQKVSEISEADEVRVEISFDPPWDRDMMSEEAKLELGFL